MNTTPQTPDYLIHTQSKTNPEIIDEIFTALNTQGGQCLNGLACSYDNSAAHLGPDATHTEPRNEHCAIGFLLDPQTPSIKLRLQSYSNALDTLIEDFEEPDLGENMPYIYDHLDLLEAAQSLHDWWNPSLSSMRRHPSPGHCHGCSPHGPLEDALESLADELHTTPKHLPDSVLKWAELRDPEFAYHTSRPANPPQNKNKEPTQ